MIHWAFLIIAFIIGAAAAIAVMCLISYGINKVDEYQRRQEGDM